MSYQSKCRQYFEKRLQEEIDRDREESKRNGWKFSERTVMEPQKSDIWKAILRVKTTDVAKRFYTGFIVWLGKMQEREKVKSQMTAEAVAKDNIGWCYGEGMSPDQIRMWVEVCGAHHPVFGTKIPSAEEAYKLGLKYVEKMEERELKKALEKGK